MTADVFRLLVAGFGCIAIGSIAVVLVNYARAWARAPRRGRALPRHVAEVSLGALGLIVGYGWIVYQRVGRETTLHWTSILFLAALLVLVIGVVDVGRLQNRRIAAAAQKRTTARTEAPTRQTRPQSSVPLGRDHDPVERSPGPGRHHRRQ